MTTKWEIAEKEKEVGGGKVARLNKRETDGAPFEGGMEGL